MFSCEFCEISKNTFFTEHFWATTSVRFKKIHPLHSVDVSSSPNSPLLFAIVFWGEANRGSLSQMKFLPATCNAIKKRLQHRCFPFQEHIFLQNNSGGCSEQTQEIYVVHCVAKWCCGHLAQVYLLVIQYHAKIVKTKSPFDISLFSKLKHAAILLLSYIVNCE